MFCIPHSSVGLCVLRGFKPLGPSNPLGNHEASISDGYQIALKPVSRLTLPLFLVWYRAHND